MMGPDDVDQGPDIHARRFIVDDEKTILDFLAEELVDDYETLLALDGQTALEIAKAKKPDIILLDIVMPGMDGYEVLRRIQGDKNMRAIPVIFPGTADSQPQTGHSPSCDIPGGQAPCSPRFSNTRFR